jgi:hypothetical protein
VGSMLCHGPSSSESPAARSIVESQPVRPEGPTPGAEAYPATPLLSEAHLIPNELSYRKSEIGSVRDWKRPHAIQALQAIARGHDIVPIEHAE